MARKRSSKKTPSDLGLLLKQTRERRGVSQAQLARLARVSTRTLHSLETGEWLRVREDGVIRLALALEASPEEWLGKAGHAYDPEQVARIIKLQHSVPTGLVEPDLVPEDRGSLDMYLVKEGRVKADKPAGKCEIWVIDAHEPPEVRNAKVLDVVRENVRMGVTYRYFYPVGVGNKPLEWHCWGFGYKEAIEGIRQRVSQSAKGKDSTHGKVLEHAIDPTEFPFFMFNMGTVILWKAGNLESEQHCYRIVNVRIPGKTWYYREEPTIASELIRFLRQKIMREEHGK